MSCIRMGQRRGDEDTQAARAGLFNDLVGGVPPKSEADLCDAAPVDLCSIGLGPSNLSLAALAAPLPELTTLFLEANDRFQWHPGLLLPQAELQVSYLKDLVTLVDPTNPYSFLNFLAEQGRLYRFLIANRDTNVSRAEFTQYYAWAAQRIPSVRFGHRVTSVDHDGHSFIVRSARRPAVRSRNLVVGVGREPYVPEAAHAALGTNLFHASEFLRRDPELAERSVVVIGGGQTGAELVDHILGQDMLPRRLTWISRRHGFLPLDDSAFSNEWFNPEFVRRFYALPEPTRGSLLARQQLASNGISEHLLSRIYRRLYDLDYVIPNRLQYALRPSCELTGVTRDGDLMRVTVEDTIAGRRETLLADVVILATGYRHVVPGMIRPLLDDGGFGDVETNFDYSLRWRGAARGRIYLQNAAERTHGVADPNLSLAAWRSAVIVNSVLGREVYRTSAYGSVLRQPEDEADPAERELVATNTGGLR
ncbi:MAG TPA: SidA/IucD/PvdA family monooxygenase [Kofleriaceae bacterium]|nr:SidA/IucD/PvdA family monooxygenase [Kofleriaceae bacterium]